RAKARSLQPHAPLRRLLEDPRPVERKRRDAGQAPAAFVVACLELLRACDAVTARIPAGVVSWLTVIAAALGILRALIETLITRARTDAAVAQALLKSNREALDAIDTALKAREQIRAALARGAAGPMSDDEFRRDD